MRYAFPLVKMEGAFLSYDDIFRDIEYAVKLVEDSRIAKKKKREVVSILKAAANEIGQLRWDAKPPANKGDL